MSKIITEQGNLLARKGDSAADGYFLPGMGGARPAVHGRLDNECLPDLFLEQVAAQPAGTAVVHGSERLDYRGLADRSMKLAAYLRHLGVSADDPIGMFVESSLELMIGAWGILLSG